MMRGEITDTFTCEGALYTDPATGVSVAWDGRIRAEGMAGTGPFLAGLYERHGPDFVDRVPGFFAVALFDPRHRRAVLARDAAGTIPLYVATGAQGQTLFATRIGDLLPQLLRVTLNPAALIDFMTFFWSVDGKTFFEGVELLPQGSVYVDGTVRRYFTFTPRPQERSEADWREAIVAALTDATRDAVGPDLGCHLSGGVDSSVLAALIARVTGQPPDVYVAAFPDYPDYDESPYSALAAEVLGAPFHHVAVRPGDFRAQFGEMMRAVEEPKCHPPVLPRFVLERAAAAQGCRLMVTGRGADELFTGYDSHRTPNLPDHRRRRTVFGPAERARLLRPDFLRRADYDPEAAYDRLFAACPGETALERLLALDFQAVMMNWLVLDHKTSGWFGTEAVAPFLDRRVMDVALQIPIDVKCPEGRTKALLKEAVRGLVPEALLTRKKVGFRTPMGEMLRAGLEDYVRGTLGPDGSAFWDLFNPAGVGDVIERHFGGGVNRGWQLWALMCMREWCRIYLEGEAGGP